MDIFLPEHKMQTDLLRINATSEIKDWSYDFYGVEDIHNRGYRGEGEVILVGDTGADKMHTDLVDANLMIHSVIGDDGYDTHGHGTWCSGRIAAEHNGAGTVGFAPDALTISVKMLGRRTGSIEGLYEFLNYAIYDVKDTTIISISAGIPFFDAKVKKFLDVAEKKAITVVSATGNNGHNGQLHYPASESSVYAIGNHDKNRNRNKSSNKSEDLDLYCAGTNVVSTGLNNGITTMTGTSMAVPTQVSLFACMRRKFIKSGYALNHYNLGKFAKSLK